MRDNQDKPKATWTKLYDVSNFTVSVSGGGAIKIEDDNSRVVCMLPGNQFEILHLVLTSLTPDQLSTAIDTASNNKAKKKEAVKINKEIAHVTEQAAKYQKALLDMAAAKGITLEQLFASAKVA